MSIKFYADPGSGSCRRVSAVINHLNIDVKEVFVDLLSGGGQQPEFLNINPTGMVPVIVIDDTAKGRSIISEAAAIMLYLCENYGGDELIPSDSRMQVLQWMFWGAEHFRQAAPIYFEENVVAPLMGRQANESRLHEAERLLVRHGDILNSHLKNRKFVVGDHVTLADFDLAAALSQMPRSHVPFERFEHIIAWEKNLEKNVFAWKVTGERLQIRMNAALNPS
jgi:glutathione S-transferase